MSAIEPIAADPFGALAAIVDGVNAAVLAAVDAGDGDTLARYVADARRVAQAMTEIRTAAEVGIQTIIEAGGEVDGWKLQPVRSKTWYVEDLLSAVLADSVPPERLASAVHDVATVLPSSLQVRVGKPGENGVRSLGLNPDDYSATITRGKRAVEVKP